MTSKHRIYPFKPLNIAVGATSTMILPPIREVLDPAVVAEWVTGTAYAQGAIVRSGARFYWAPVAGTSGATAPAHVDGDANDGGMVWRVVRGLREVLSIANLGDGVVYIARGYAAEVQKGLMLGNNGCINEGYENGLVRPYEGAYYSISSGSSLLTISEG